MLSIRSWIAGFTFGFFCAAASGAEPYKFLTEIPIGGEGGWDILTVDSTAGRLYLSHGTKVVVVELNKNAVAGEIADTRVLHGCVAVAEFQRGLSTNGQDKQASEVDHAALKPIS